MVASSGVDNLRSLMPLERLWPYSAFSTSLSSLPRHHRYLFLGQPIQFVHQRVYLAVGGLDLALVQLLVGGDGGGGQFLVQRQYALLAAPLRVAHVPTQGLEERVNELDAHLGFFVRGLLVMVQVALKAFDQFQDLVGWGHFVFLGW